MKGGRYNNQPMYLQSVFGAHEGSQRQQLRGLKACMNEVI